MVDVQDSLSTDSEAADDSSSSEEEDTMDNFTRLLQRRREGGEGDRGAPAPGDNDDSIPGSP